MSAAWREQFPLRAKGRHLVNQRGERFKLAGVNWFGASDVHHVVGGLDVRPLRDICSAIAAMGFTVVRLPFSNAMLRVQDSVPEKVLGGGKLNADLLGLMPLEVLDRVVDALGDVHVAVVLNNHTTLARWSGGGDENGYWFLEGDDVYTEQAWIADWRMLARRYQDRPHVVGFDLRNEVRPTSVLGAWGVYRTPFWGGGGGAATDASPGDLSFGCVEKAVDVSGSDEEASLDWARAAGACARALLAERAEPSRGPFIVVERICWPQDSLRAMMEPEAVWDVLRVPRDCIVLAVHMYSWSGPGAWNPKCFTPTPVRDVLEIVDFFAGSKLYGEMSSRELEQAMDAEWGFCLDEDICPVWLSEFGTDASSKSQLCWFELTCSYLARKDADFAYWPLNVGPKPGSGGDERYGLLTNDWQPRWCDPRVRALHLLAPDGSHRSAKPGPCLQAPPGWHQRRHTYSSTFVPTKLPHPWCAPLPGPLVPECYKLSLAKPNGEAGDCTAAVAVLPNIVAKTKVLCTAWSRSPIAVQRASGKMLPVCSLTPQDCSSLASIPPPAPRAALLSGCCPLLRRGGRGGAGASPSDFIVLDLPRASDDDIARECQLACALHGLAGFVVLPNVAQALLLPGRQALRASRDKIVPFPSLSLFGPRRGHLWLVGHEQVTVGLERHPGRDAFPGSNAGLPLALRDRQESEADLEDCLQQCLQHGYGGFAVFGGQAYFRTASSCALQRNLREASPDTIFYVLAV